MQLPTSAVELAKTGQPRFGISRWLESG